MSSPASRPILTLEDLGKRIKSARRESGVSGIELSRQTGVSRNTLHRIESGEDCAASTLLRLLKAMGYNLDIAARRRPTLEGAARMFADDEDDDQ